MKIIGICSLCQGRVVDSQIVNVQFIKCLSCNAIPKKTLPVIEMELDLYNFYDYVYKESHKSPNLRRKS